jgi:hypothetical protein
MSIHCAPVLVKFVKIVDLLKSLEWLNLLKSLKPMSIGELAALTDGLGRPTPRTVSGVRMRHPQAAERMLNL